MEQNILPFKPVRTLGRIHLIFQPEAVIKESDLNRSLKSELHVRPIHPPSAMQAKHILASKCGIIREYA